MNLGQHFTLAEFTASATALKHGWDNTPPMEERKALQKLVRFILDPLRIILCRPITITSGYRSPRVNVAAGGTLKSQHTMGQAADIKVLEYQGRPAIRSAELVQIINTLGLPYDQLIDEFGKWVHVSYGPRNRREALRARKGKFGTEYTPFEEPR